MTYYGGAENPVTVEHPHRNRTVYSCLSLESACYDGVYAPVCNSTVTSLLLLSSQKDTQREIIHYTYTCGVSPATGANIPASTAGADLFIAILPLKMSKIEKSNLVEFC